MENKSENENIKNEGNNIILSSDKIELDNQNKAKVINNNEIKENEEKKETDNENNINKIDKNQMLQDKLKKIFIERETNKFKYNIVNIPDNLKYTSDNSNSSSPKKPDNKNNKKDIKDVNIITNEINVNNSNNKFNNNEINIKKNDYNKNGNETINNNNEKNLIIEKEKINEKSYKEVINKSNNNSEKKNNMNNYEKTCISNNNSNEKSNSKFNSNEKNNMNNNNIEKYSNNSYLNNNINNNNKNDIDNNKYNNNLNNNDNNWIKNYRNNNNDNNIDNNNTNNNIVGHNQVCKNYVIKRIPERKKKQNNINEEEIRNRTFSMGFANHRRKVNSKNKNDEKNSSLKIIESKEKEILDNNINNDSKEENEEEKNKRLYRQLMAKKLGGNNQNVIMSNKNSLLNSNESKNKMENENNICIRNKENSEFFEEKKKEINNIYTKNEENKNDNTSSDKKNKKERSRTMIKVSTAKEINAKEGALKILELIKAKKNEKNFIDQKKKETQDIFKKAKSQQVDFTETNSTVFTKEEDNNNENKIILTQSLNKNFQIKEKPKITVNDYKLMDNNKKEEKNKDKDKENKEDKNDNDIREIPKRIYRRFKGKSSFIGANNNNANNNNSSSNVKNEFDNEVTNNLKNIKFSGIKQDKNNITDNRELIENKFKTDTIERNDNRSAKKNINLFDNNGYKTDFETNNNNNKNSKIYFKGKTNNQNINDNQNSLLNSEEKIRRQKLENDVAAEINKDEISTCRDYREKNNSKSKYLINRNNTSLNINKQYFISSKKPQINIKHSYNETNSIKIDNNNNNSSQNQNIITYSKTSIYNSNPPQKIIHNYSVNPNQKKYEQIKTFENPKKILDNPNKKLSANNINVNNRNNENKLIYAPKKCHMLSKEKTKISSLNPFSPNYISKNVSNSKNMSNAKNLSNTKNLSNAKNLSNKKTMNRSPKIYTSYNDDKLTYIKKNLSNISSNKKDTDYKLNNSLGNIPSSFNNNFDINRIIKNKVSTEIDTLELKHNLNSSFQLRMNLEKSKYNRGNIFNQDNDDINIINNNNNNNLNLNSSYNNRFYHQNQNVTRFNKNNNNSTNNIGDGYNTFYPNNKLSNNNVNRNLYKSINNNYNFNPYDKYNKYDNDNNYGTAGSINKNRSNINSIYSYNNSVKKRYDNDNYKNINILNNINNININNNMNNYSNNNNNNNINNDYQLKLYDALKYEDLLILEDKLITIMFSLSQEKLIYNECFDFWNYFFNCSLYENIKKIFSNYDSEYKNLIKISINYNLMSIILSYDTSFEQEKLNKIRPLLLEMLELCHKLLISTFELILNITKNNNNMWIKKLYHLINSSKLSDGSDALFIDSTKMSEKDKMKYNINFLMQKIYYILYNYPSNNSQSYLMSLFKKINNKSYEDINDFFLEYILREKDIKYSVLATTFLKSGEVITPKPLPYLNYNSPKKYTLVLDVDETLFHFKINEEDEEQGVLKIRPGVFQFIDKIKEFYEIILFSEAEQNYIELITEAVVENKYFYDCILCRDYVTIVEQNFVKELSKIGRPLDRLIIIDNMPQNFSFNKENSIYIKSFWGEENDDKALIDLIPILVNIAKSGNDVRKELVKYKEKIVTRISSNLYKHNNI